MRLSSLAPALAPALAFAFTSALVAVLPSAAPAQQTVLAANGRHGPILATKDGLVLPAGDFAVTDLIDAVAGYLCRNYLFDHAEVEKVQGFTLQRSLALDALGSEEMLYALLAARGLAALPIDELRGVFQVVSLTQNPRALPITNVPWRTPEDILRRRHLRELVLTAVPVHHADARQLADGLRAQFSYQGMWQPGMPTAVAGGPQTLILHGYRDQVAATILFVQLVDRDAAAAARPADPVLARVEALERELAELKAELARRPASGTTPAAATRR